ncbi:hypothetical protein K2Z83_14960 [Oscillochloris sp. ZM17-4]|uniref:hypothetical protein n=1 Tax=Oscillochloris sp. ZM17-4 TaxID=2866714 RepID=UPI001C73BF3F|nr:hypothetical protein [Oscillochloris sp. ZM17-4]MBX0328976.1 hypothetical protein [Oscillochloris sp. ZM17-4]
MQPPRHLARLITLAVLLCAAVGFAGQSTYARGDANAQTPTAAGISFGNPNALTVTVAAGDDFATNVLGDAWDMNVARDLGYEIAFHNISASNGIWSGTYSGVEQASGTASTGYVFPLFQGFSTPIGGQLSQELIVNKIGASDRYAINAAKYTRLSYRMSVSPRDNSRPMAVYWTTAKPVTWPTNNNYFARTDACQGTTAFFPWSGWHVYNFDMTQQNGAAGNNAGAWAGTVRGLRIDPSIVNAAGTQVKIDWIRLSDPRSAPTISIPWNITGAEANDRVDIYVADNAAGTDAAPIAYGILASAGKYDLPTSILPPGQHYFQLRLKDKVENGCTVSKSVSAWVGPLTIADEPVITFAKPSMTSGPDYATEVLNQPWDMSGSDDIVTPGAPYPQTIANATYSNGIFSARAIINAPQTESDSQIWLHVDPSRPINSNRYRYFTVRLKVDMPAGRDINWAISNGWGGRVIWWNTGIQTDGSESKYGTYYEGWRNYSVDLAQAVPPLPLSNLAQADNILTPREQNSFPAQRGWTQLGSVSYLRFDPLETMQAAVGTGADIFSIDWVTLTANDEVKRGQIFRIEAGVNVTPSSLQSITYYYTTSRSQPTQSPALSAAQTAAAPAPQAATNTVYLPMVTIPTLNPVAGNPLAYNWDTSGVAPGTYYICSVANTGTNTATYCSDTPVVVLP